MHLFHNVSDNAIMHIDADAFFASCEQARNPAYQGKPLITGKERGIVAAASYEAKKYGVKRGVSLADAKLLCPELIILPSDYETYSLFSKRMFHIIRQYTPVVEEYSIDEAFADITGLRRPLKKNYTRITQEIKGQIEKQLGLTVSVGLSPTKVLSKIGSRWQKPAGLTVIKPYTIAKYLEKCDIEDVWGIGYQTASYLHKFGVKTALDFVLKNFVWVKKHLTKPHQEIWQELQGKTVYEVNPKEKQTYNSISKTKTFTPPAKDPLFILGQLAKNVENAFIKARRYRLAAGKMFIFLRKQNFHFYGSEATLNRPTSFPSEVMPIVKQVFDKIFQGDVLHRATGVILTNLQVDDCIQMSLFEDPLCLEKLKRVYGSLDQLSKKYGKHTLFLGTSLPVHQNKQPGEQRRELPEVKKLREKQIHKRKFLNLPMLLGKVD